MQTATINTSKKSKTGEKRNIEQVHKLKISGFSVCPRELTVHVGDKIQFYIDPSDKSNLDKKTLFEFSFKSSVPSLCLKKTNEISLNKIYKCESSWTSSPLSSAGILEFRENINGSTSMAGSICIETVPATRNNTEASTGTVEESLKLTSSARRRAKAARRKARENQHIDLDDVEKNDDVCSNNIQNKTNLPAVGVTLELLKKVEQQCQTRETHSLLNLVREQREESLKETIQLDNSPSEFESPNHHGDVQSTTHVFDVLVKQGRFDPSNLVIEGGSTVNWRVASTVVGSLRLACSALGLESPAISPGCCWSCTFPHISPEMENSHIVSFNRETGKYETVVQMEDQVFLGKCSLEISSKKISGPGSKKSSPTEKLPSDSSPTKSVYCSSDSSFFDSDDLLPDEDQEDVDSAHVYPTDSINVGCEHPAVASRYSGMPPQLATRALMGSFGGVGLMSNAGATKPLSEFKVKLPPRYTSKSQRMSAWNTYDSDSFEEEVPGESFAEESNQRDEAEDLFPTQEASKYGNLVLPSALDLSPLTSPESTPAHSPDRRRVSASPSKSSMTSWGDCNSQSATAVAAAAVASMLVGDSLEVSLETSPSCHTQNLPGLPFRMVNSSRCASASTHARRVRVYEDSEGTADSDDASSLSSAATPVSRSPKTPLIARVGDALHTKFRSPSSLNAVSKDILNDLFMADLKQDKIEMEDKEQEQNDEVVHNVDEVVDKSTYSDKSFGIKKTKESKKTLSVTTAEFSQNKHLDLSGADGDEPKKKRKKKKKTKQKQPVLTDDSTTANVETLIPTSFAIEVDNTEINKGVIVENEKNDINNNVSNDCGNDTLDIVFGSFQEVEDEELGKHMVDEGESEHANEEEIIRNEELMAMFHTQSSEPNPEVESEWISNKNNKKKKKQQQKQQQKQEHFHNDTIKQETVISPPLPPGSNEYVHDVHEEITSRKPLSKVERDAEDFFSSRYNNLLEVVRRTGMDAFPGGKQVPIEVVGGSVYGFS